MNTVVKGMSSWDHHAGRNFVAVLLTSQVAALIMAVVVMAVFTLFLGKGPLFPVQVIGSTFVGEPALHGFNLAALLTGLVLHQGVGLAWGVVFGVAAYVLKVDTVKASMLLGVAVAVVSMVDSYVIVPAVMNALQGVDYWNQNVPMFWNWAAHIVLGLGFGFFPVIADKLAKRA